MVPCIVEAALLDLSCDLLSNTQSISLNFWYKHNNQVNNTAAEKKKDRSRTEVCWEGGRKQYIVTSKKSLTSDGHGLTNCITMFFY